MWYALHCLECRYIVLNSLLVGIIVSSVYPCQTQQPVVRTARRSTTRIQSTVKTYEEQAGEVDFQYDLLVTSIYAKRKQNSVNLEVLLKPVKDTYIEKPFRSCSRCIRRVHKNSLLWWLVVRKVVVADKSCFFWLITLA